MVSYHETELFLSNLLFARPECTQRKLSSICSFYSITTSRKVQTGICGGLVLLCVWAFCEVRHCSCAWFYTTRQTLSLSSRPFNVGLMVYSTRQKLPLSSRPFNEGLTARHCSCAWFIPRDRHCSCPVGLTMRGWWVHHGSEHIEGKSETGICLKASTYFVTRQSCMSMKADRETLFLSSMPFFQGWLAFLYPRHWCICLDRLVLTWEWLSQATGKWTFVCFLAFLIQSTFEVLAMNGERGSACC